MGYRCYFKGQTADNKIKEEICLGKLYGYNEESDGLMLGYAFIKNTPEYKEYKKDEEPFDISEYTDYEIIDLCFTARGSIDMHVLTEQFLVFFALYLFDYQSVWREQYSFEKIERIREYLKDCVSVFIEWV